jgi:hypothetical protein
MPKFKKVKAGENFSFSAPLYNNIIDVIQAFEQSQRVGGGGVPSGLQSGMAWGKNNIGEDLDASEVVALGDAVNDEPGSGSAGSVGLDVFKKQILIEIREPQVPRDLGRFAITLEPIEDGGVGRVALAGCWPVQVYVRRKEHRWCDLIAMDLGECTSSGCPVTGSGSGLGVILATGHAGAGEIVWKENVENGEYAWAYVQFPQYVHRLYSAVGSVDTDLHLLEGRPILQNGEIVDAPQGSIGSGGRPSYFFDTLYSESGS